MLKTRIKMLMLTMMLLTISAVVVAGTTKSSDSLADKLETRLAGMAPNTVIISVDEKGRLARLNGTVSSQADMDRITEMVRGISGVRVISSDLRVNTQAGTMGDTSDAQHTDQSMTTDTSDTQHTDQSTTTDMDHTQHTDQSMTSDMDHSSTQDRSTTGDETTAMGNEMDHSTMAGGSLATQIDERFMDLSPDTLIVIVDELTNTAYVRGNLASQAQIDNINNMLNESGVRIAGTNMIAGDRTFIGSGTTTDSAEQPKLSGGISGTSSGDDDHTTTTTPRTMTVSDASLRAAVEEALKSEGIMGQSKIAIETENGVVTLTGAALSETHADRIVALTMSVPGVVRVEPNLTLRDQKRRYQVKPSTDRDKDGFQVDSPESRVPEDREGDVDVDVDVDNPDTDDDDDDNEQ